MFGWNPRGIKSTPTPLCLILFARRLLRFLYSVWLRRESEKSTHTKLSHKDVRCCLQRLLSAFVYPSLLWNSSRGPNSRNSLISWKPIYKCLYCAWWAFTTGILIKFQTPFSRLYRVESITFYWCVEEKRLVLFLHHINYCIFFKTQPCTLKTECNFLHSSRICIQKQQNRLHNPRSIGSSHIHLSNTLISLMLLGCPKNNYKQGVKFRLQKCCYRFVVSVVCERLLPVD